LDDGLSMVVLGYVLLLLLLFIFCLVGCCWVLRCSFVFYVLSYLTTDYLVFVLVDGTGCDGLDFGVIVFIVIVS